MNIDVILISYNQELYIQQALDSIFMQEVGPDIHVKVIIADDCSQDNTYRILKENEKRSPFPFVFLETKYNLGIVDNYKSALSVCDGDYVAILEGDDYWIDKKRLQHHLGYLMSHSDCVLTVNDRIDYDQNRNSFIYSEEKGPSVISLSTAIANYDLIRNLSACVFSNEALKNINPILFDKAKALKGICMDQYIVHDVLQRGFAFRLSDVMSVYRINTGTNASMRIFTKDEQVSSFIQMCNDANELLCNRYTFEFNKLLNAKIKESETHYIWQLKTKYKLYFPPILVDFIFYIPHVFCLIKSFLRDCIPNALYAKAKLLMRKN